MKQLNFHIINLKNLNNTLSDLQVVINEDHYSSMLFHLYSSTYTDSQINYAQKEISRAFPSACICGTSSNGDICDGLLSEFGMVMAVSIFESTNINVKLFPCEPGDEEIVGYRIRDFIDNTDEIKAAEIIITLKTINSHNVLRAVESLKKDIPVFGGGSANSNLFNDSTKVFNETDICHNGIVVVTYSGPDLFVDVKHAIGWKPLGKEFLATKIDGNRLYELNGIPAGKVYSHYLDIQADDDFFTNILEFPIMANQHGNEVLRLPFSCNKDDKSIILAADIDEGTPIHLSYGDPEVIQGDVSALVKNVKEFAPQAIFLVSCGVRKIYWKYLINEETGPFATIASVAGFYSTGEIMRMDKYLIEHHVTLIAISMREGKKIKTKANEVELTKLPIPDKEKVHSQISMVRRLANFINVTSAELQETNKRLQEMADTDELTGLYNRRMITKLVTDALTRANKYNLDMVLGIVDIDHFKEVNDTYGHAVGDMVLKEISNAVFKEVEKLPSGIFGRWGGEEFLFLAPTLNIDTIKDNLEEARKRVSSIELDTVGSRSISVGVTGFKKGDTLETIFARADAALYEAKETGRNKLCFK